MLYVGNHRSYFDILLTSVRAPRPTGYVAKIEMLRYPLLRNWMRNIRCTFLDRKDVKKGMKTILDNIALLKNGISVCVFPEGTRNKTSASLLEFHDGSLKMAEKSGCPIVPMAINNSGAIFEDHLPKIVKSHVVIEYCDPIYMEDLSKEEKRFIGKQVADITVTHYEKNKRAGLKTGSLFFRIHQLLLPAAVRSMFQTPFRERLLTRSYLLPAGDFLFPRKKLSLSVK